MVGRGRGGDGGGGRKGKGGKPQFTRVIPKFLQKYETMLTGPKPGHAESAGEESYSGGGAYVDGGGPRSPSATSGVAPRAEQSSQGGSLRGQADTLNGVKGSADPFGDYDAEEVAALEEYMKTHPSKEEDREAVRRRARELSARISSNQDKQATGERRDRSKTQAGAWRGESADTSAVLEYTDAAGNVKFNKRHPGSSAYVGDDAAGARKVDKKKAKRAKLAKLSNAKLLSFGHEEDG